MGNTSIVRQGSKLRNVTFGALKNCIIYPSIQVGNGKFSLKNGGSTISHYLLFTSVCVILSVYYIYIVDIYIPYAPWCWYIQPQNWVILEKGKCWFLYSSTMESHGSHMGIADICIHTHACHVTQPNDKVASHDAPHR